MAEAVAVLEAVRPELEKLPPEKRRIVSTKLLLAAKKYARKVCEEYLGLPAKACYKVFPVMWKRMREAFLLYAKE